MARGQRGHRGHTPKSPTVPTISGACPDCDADAELTRDTFGIYHLTIRHNSTCPWLNTRTR